MSDIERRSADMRAVIGEHTEGPLVEFVAALMCNGCGAVLVANNSAELAEQATGWTIAQALGGDDLCPKCSA